MEEQVQVRINDFFHQRICVAGAVHQQGIIVERKVFDLVAVMPVPDFIEHMVRGSADHSRLQK